ncbi:MAG: GGDEF domain-containing protein [Desulfopila sp.]
MEAIRAAIIDQRSKAINDDEFIRQLNTLIQDHGEVVCPIILNIIANIDITQNTAKKYWNDIQNHRLQLMQTLGRAVTLTTATSDYLQCYTNFLHTSCLVDAEAFERAVSGTIHDNLTGLFNRPYFNETYELQIALARRYHMDLSILFLDIDDFKDVNDTYGHKAGDYALQKIAEIIQTSKRESDIAARYGGEEFVMLLPNTNCSEAAVLAERIRAEVDTTLIMCNDMPIHLTISGGLASFPLNADNPKDLLFMADSAVYLAKGSGKNTISQFREEQRRYLRMKIRRPILCKELGFDETRVYSGVSRNIGLGGILMENDRPLSLGSTHTMRISMQNNGEDGRNLLLIGKVVRVENGKGDTFDIGFQFSFNEMARTAHSQIASLLKGTAFAQLNFLDHEPVNN